MSDINEFTFWKASYVQNPKNYTYPAKETVTDAIVDGKISDERF